MLAELMLAAAVAGLSVCPDDQVLNPDWREKPTEQDVSWAYPPAAVEQGLEGGATVSCAVNIDGVLENCFVVAEEPRGYGFGEAALGLTPLMKMTPKRACGVRVRSAASIPVHFMPPDEAPAQADPQLMALARRLMVAAGNETAINARFEQELQSAYGVGERDDRMSIDERRAAYEAARDTWATVKDKVTEPLVRSYATRMSRQELELAVAFFEAAAGQRVVQQMQRFVVLSRQPVITPKLVDDFRERYCARVQPCAPPKPR